MKQHKIRTAGPLVWQSLAPRPASREPAQIRREKRQLSSKAQQLMNVKYSWMKLMFRLAANFLPGDLVVTLTYDDEHLPETRAQAMARLKNFRNKMAKARRRRNKDFFSVYSTEHLHSSSRPAEDGRWHHHIIINATGDDFREILAAWPYGSNVEIHPLELTERRTYETLAKYMAKERQDTANAHVWSCTRNCRKEETESRIVPDDWTMNVPETAVHVRRESKTTEYGSFEVVQYIDASPSALRQQRPKAKRKH